MLLVHRSPPKIERELADSLLAEEACLVVPSDTAIYVAATEPLQGKKTALSHALLILSLLSFCLIFFLHCPACKHPSMWVSLGHLPVFCAICSLKPTGNNPQNDDSHSCSQDCAGYADSADEIRIKSNLIKTNKQAGLSF